jgi:UDP-2,3-diacylglucosamine hydrolase
VKRLFIADLHLQPNTKNQKTTTPLQQIVEKNQALFASLQEIYFLGDVFEYWVGLDHGEKFYHQDLATLKQLSHTTKCFFIRGNRDVLFSTEDAEALNFTLLEDPSVISYNPNDPNCNKNILLTHGDFWTTRFWDKLYHQLILNNIILQKIIRKLSIKKRTQFAEFLRKKSNGKHYQTNAQQPSQKIINTPQAVKNLNTQSDFNYFQKTSTYEVIICGHFHHPGSYFTDNNTPLYQLGNLRKTAKQHSIYTLLLDSTLTEPTFILLED